MPCWMHRCVSLNCYRSFFSITLLHIIRKTFPTILTLVDSWNKTVFAYNKLSPEDWLDKTMQWRFYFFIVNLVAQEALRSISKYRNTLLTKRRTRKLFHLSLWLAHKQSNDFDLFVFSTLNRKSLKCDWNCILQSRQGDHSSDKEFR